MGRVRWGNCWLYAHWMHLRNGGYLIVRRSHIRKFGRMRLLTPHYLWSPDLKTFYQFKPVADYRWAIIPPPLFRGCVHVSTHDEE